MKIPILYNKDFENFNRDVLPLYGKDNGYEEIYPRFKGVGEFCKNTFEYNEKEGIIVFPQLLNHMVCEEDLKQIEKYKSNIIYGFSNDIVDDEYNYKDNIILYRTALLKSKKKKSEFSFPAFCEDWFKNTYVNKISIGYCGHLMYGRKDLIEKLNLLKIEKDFIIRNELLTGTKDVNKRKDFYDNIERNLFIFCYRGAGNYCYRFYETLMMGRIPILFESDREFIFEKDIDLNEVCVLLNVKDNIIELEEKIMNFIHQKNIFSVQKQNRNLWLEYCSPIGFLKQFVKGLL